MKHNYFEKRIVLLLFVFFLFTIPQLHAQEWVWAKSAGVHSGIGPDIGVSDIAVDKAGNIYVVGGCTNSFPNPMFDSISVYVANWGDFYIAKYNASGKALWVKSFGGTGSDDVKAVTTDEAGNVYICGNSDSPEITFGTTTLTNTSITPGWQTFFLTKLDPSGNVLWARSTNTGLALAASVCADHFGHLCLAGRWNSGSVSFGAVTLADSATVYVVQYDTAGNVIWAREGGGIDGTPQNVAADASGNIFVSGYFQEDSAKFGAYTLNLTNPGLYQPTVFLAKYDSSGTVLWAKSPGSNGDAWAPGLATDRAGNVCIGGFFNSDTLIFDTTRLILSSGSPGNSYLAKYNSSGNLLWARSGSAGSAMGDNQMTHIDVDAIGNIYAIGNFLESITFGGITLSSVTSSPEFLVKFDSSGNATLGLMPGGFGIFSPDGVAADDSGNVYWAGSFDFPIIFGSTTLTSMSCRFMYLAKYATCSGSVGTISGPSSVCAGHSIALTDTLTGGAWSAANGHATVTAGVVTGATPGIDTINYTVHHACMSYINTVTTTVAVTVAIPADPGVINGPDTVCLDSFITLTDSAPGGVWSSSVLSVATISTSGVVTGSISTGGTIIKYSVTNECGTVAAEKFVTVVDCTATGITNTQQGAINIYPNPTQNDITITSGKPIGNIGLYDLLGQTMITDFSNNDSITISLAQLPAGIYFLKVNNEKVYKVVKQ